jgi:Na+/melibiose symporter-like transporter
MALMPLLILVAAGIVAALIGRRMVIPTAFALAVAHVAWIVLGDDATSEDSTTTLIALSAIFIYVPALLGLIGGLLIRHVARTRDQGIERA